MSWVEKGTPTPFDNQPIEGLFFLDGDLPTHPRSMPWAEGKYYPIIRFPSGARCDLWRHGDPTNAIVRFFGAVDLPLFDTRDRALSQAQVIAQEYGYEVSPVGEDSLEVRGEGDEHVRITYNPDQQRMSNVVFTRAGEVTNVAASNFLDDEALTRLPKLVLPEGEQLDRIAPVKFYLPDTEWAWYPVAYNGHGTLYGLVKEQYVAVEYFSVMELAQLRARYGARVIRDYDFTPTTLFEIANYHLSSPPQADQDRALPTTYTEMLESWREEIMTRFKQLPPEWKVSLAMQLVNSIMGEEWVTEMLDQSDLSSAAFPQVDRSDFQRAGFSEEELALLTDADIAAIAGRMRDHYLNDLFEDELRFHTDDLLDNKGDEKPSEGESHD